MKHTAVVITGVCAALFVVLAVSSLVTQATTPSALTYARTDAEINRLRREDARAETLQPLDLAIAAGWRVLPLVACVAGLLYAASLGVAHVARFRDERMPDSRGLLPVLQVDQHTARLALGGFHSARQIEAARQNVPHSLTYSPHNNRTDSSGIPLLPADVTPTGLPGITDLASLGFVPTKDQILLGLGVGGELLTVPADNLCHVALVGATGGGKSALLRLLLPQLIAVGAQVTIADPHFTMRDPKTGEDWRGIANRLHMAPAISPTEIASLFGYLTDELARRIELRRNGQKVGAPLFLALDELPVIADEVPGAVDQLGKLLREGRKFGIYSVGASQSMLVKVVGGDSAARECYRTCYYVGGDIRSASSLLDMPQRDVPEGELGEGIAMLRSKATSPARMVRIPWATNEAIDQLLGGSVSPVPEAGERPLGFQHPARGKPDGSLMEARTREASSASPSAASARVLALFRAGLDVAQIVRELHGVEAGTGGRKYQILAAEIQKLLREALAFQG